MSLPARARKPENVNQEQQTEIVILANQEIQEIIYYLFQPNQVPLLLKKGGGGRISKVMENKANLRMILAKPEDDNNAKYFRYSIIHEYLDNSTDEQKDMVDIEQEVWNIYQQESKKDGEETNEKEQKNYIQSRIDFFQGQLDQNNSVNELSEEEKQHNNQIQHTLNRLYEKSLNLNS